MQDWGTPWIEKLRRGEAATFQVFGRSMEPKIADRSMVEFRPLDGTEPRAGDVVLCSVRGRSYLHLVKDTRKGPEYLIGNNKGRINGWVPADQVHGILVSARAS